MNFLSHYYFDRNGNNSYHILGTVLPDLLKNADKTIVLHPEKLIHTNPDINAIVTGWNKHLAVDRHFHSSDFFLHHSHELKVLLAPVIKGSPVKPFFLGHIGVELILDNLLLTTQKLSVDSFYYHLAACNNEVIAEFLANAELTDDIRFFKFFAGFKSSAYLHTYAETLQVAYALKRICMRVWSDPFTAEQETAISEVVLAYRQVLLPVFMDVFEEIESKLSVR
ncbi:MAG: hypothetical protein EOP47_02465 [Sphingobacteriaceae bacterium]|nr:MAG: hypothetical protein EOP47_02465 [Sphingobacteriaceae bacterium]